MLAGIKALQLLGFFLPLCLLCGVLTSIDLRRGIIPDRLNLAVAGLGLAKAVVTGGAAAGKPGFYFS